MVDHPQLRSVELTNLLTLPADESWDVGQTYRPSPNSPEQRYQFSRWAIRAAGASLDGLTDAIRELANRIQGVEQKFLLLPTGTTVSLTLFVTETDTVIGMGIEAEVVKLLARINAGIEVSLVVTQA
ncbi:MAG: hypothetical protein ACK59Y_07655 [Betaproteobacteria bacterium]|jgi:hypothetical protein